MFDNDGPWENNTIEDPLETAPSEFEEVQDDNDLCDCDPEYKESQTVQRSTGATFGGFGGQMGDGTTVIVCTKCGGRFYEKDSDQQRGNGFDSMF
ncbi:hypothetical protein [Haladaptatus sp. DJG-WS-42]|uniref:hypothetical protein n=1 Tax=Haladaptatus sp. DJG-WS-42 TaxID=3120516 RepID=UPI0030D532EE